MTIAEAIEIRQREEAICAQCARAWCRICTQCLHNSLFAKKRTYIGDETLKEYREY